MRLNKIYVATRYFSFVCLLLAFGSVRAQIITTWAGNGTNSTVAGDGGPATAAAIFPTFMAKDAAGNIYVTELNKQIVRKITPSGIVSVFAGTMGSFGYSGDGGAATAAKLGAPSGIAVDGSGQVYIAENGNNRIRKVSTAGIITTVAGTGLSGYTGDGGPATAAQLSDLGGLGCDATGNLYLTQRNNNRIRKISTTGIITTVAGSNSGIGDNGVPATSVTISAPWGIAVDDTGNIYFTESSKIKKVTYSGMLYTIAGNGVSGAPADTGMATASALNGASGVCLDGKGNLFFAVNSVFNNIHKVNLSTGRISTVAGINSAGSFSGDGGPATAATLNFPLGLIFDNGGDMLVADQYNFRVRKIACSHVNVTISSPTGICMGSSYTLSASIAGGTWSSASPAIASINSAGIVTGVAGGVTTLSYSLPSSCGVTTVTQPFTIVTAPYVPPLAGPSSVCVGATITLTDSVAYGLWSSTAPTVATVSATGVVTGITAGTANIYYAVSSSCGTTFIYKTITVNAAPVVPAIGGVSSVCTGANITLTNTTTGGTWSSSSVATASVSTAGVVRGNTAGSASISYTVTNTCGTTVVTKIVTVNALPAVAATLGSSALCAGNTLPLSNATPGGVWSSSATAIATVNTSGAVTGISAGNVTISYVVTNTCGSAVATKPLLVVPGTTTAAAISGASSVCLGATTTLSNTTSGGTWSSSDAGIASVSTAGVVRGNAIGTATISYYVVGSCGSALAAKVVTVNAAPVVPAIGGASSVCTGADITLTNTTTGGTWSSSSVATASVSAAGVVRGNTVGNATISYTVSNTCGTTRVTKVVTVNGLPTVAATGGTTASVCTGANITFTNATTGGVWSSSNTAIASVNATGVVRGVAAGITNIVYGVSNSCGSTYVFKEVTVNAAPVVAAIGGTTSSVCVGTNITLTDVTTGGVWSSSNTAIASVSAAGVVRGNTAGTATITYSVAGTCGTGVATRVVTVSTGTVAVAAISGLSSICAGSVATFTDATVGGTWSSSATAIATVSPAGAVRGVAYGDAVISYTVPNTCGTGTSSAVASVHVNPLATISAITGTSSLNVGASTSLTCTGVAWSSSNTSVASVNSVTGVVTGIAAGTATISCSSSNACGTVYATFAITVTTPAPLAVYNISTYAGTGTLGFSGDGGAASSAQFSYPYAVAVTSAGTVYVADQVNNRIRKITSTGIISTIAGNGTYGNTGDGGAATAATLANPQGVAVDAAGNVYVADYGNNRIRKISTTGIITNFAGSGTGVDGGAATAADVYHPSAVAVDASGNVYIAETGNNRVRKVNTSGIISTVAGTGVSGFSGDGGSATAAKLSSPFGVSTDASGNVYIADLGNNRIRKVSGGVISTVAGTGVAGFSGDGGAATSAAINTPYGMTLDASGNMYICDYNNFRIRRVSSTGVISTIAGTGTATYGGDGGLATLADLNRPTGIAVDASGNIYIADNNNQRVRKLCVLPVSGTITGPTTVVMGNNITLSTTGTGGTWSSVFTAKATVASSGMVHAIASGVDTIKYTATNSCGTSRSVYVINITTSKPGANAIEPAAQATVLNVYPNPSTGLLNLETAQDKIISQVLVFDIAGKLMQQVSGSANAVQVNISDYTPGMYILKVMHQDGEISQVRVVKE
jgi:uncharacterized protein YjdB